MKCNVYFSQFCVNVSDVVHKKRRTAFRYGQKKKVRTYNSDTESSAGSSKDECSENEGKEENGVEQMSHNAQMSETKDDDHHSEDDIASEGEDNAQSRTTRSEGWANAMFRILNCDVRQKPTAILAKGLTDQQIAEKKLNKEAQDFEIDYSSHPNKSNDKQTEAVIRDQQRTESTKLSNKYLRKKQLQV